LGGKNYVKIAYSPKSISKIGGIHYLSKPTNNLMTLFGKRAKNSNIYRYSHKFELWGIKIISGIVF